MPSLTALSKCPQLIFVPARFELYREISFWSIRTWWNRCRWDEAYLDVTVSKPGTASSATVIAREIKQRFKKTTGLTVSECRQSYCRKVSRKGGALDVDDKMKERTIEELLYALDECFKGEGRDGGVFLELDDPGLFSILRALNAEEASRPVAGMSIATHVFHLIFALDVFVKRIGGDKGAVPADWSASWRESLLNEAEWTCLKKELADLREKAVFSARGANLCEARGVSHLRLILGLLTHTIFHLGIIRVKYDVIKG
jgi:hypothetical protein